MNRLPTCILSLLLVVPAAADDKSFPTSFEWGEITTTDTAVELHVTSLPDKRVVRVPRFNNSYQRIYLKGDPKKKSLKFRPEVSEWLITLPETASVPTTVVMKTVGLPMLLAQPHVNQADEDGVLNLPAHHAVVHGKLLRFEPQPFKNTVGYWANEKDWCEWKLDVETAGTYEVHVLQGCGKGHGGSEVQVSVGGSSLTFVVQDTGHFQKFKDRHVGSVSISKKGAQSLKVVPVNKAKGAIMDVRLIRLVPAGS